VSTEDSLTLAVNGLLLSLYTVDFIPDLLVVVYGQGYGDLFVLADHKRFEPDGVVQLHGACVWLNGRCLLNRRPRHFQIRYARQDFLGGVTINTHAMIG